MDKNKMIEGQRFMQGFVRLCSDGWLHASRISTSDRANG